MDCTPSSHTAPLPPLRPRLQSAFHTAPAQNYVVSSLAVSANVFVDDGAAPRGDAHWDALVWHEVVLSPRSAGGAASDSDSLVSASECVTRSPTSAATLKCGACWEDSSDVVATLCGHIFCATCISNLFDGDAAPACPVCRTPLDPLSVHRLFINV